MIYLNFTPIDPPAPPSIVQAATPHQFISPSLSSLIPNVKKAKK